tara:strand:- start:279 stop:653 length:375 start_codon:yes stop_codon:yes gene_type:complete
MSTLEVSTAKVTNLNDGTTTLATTFVTNGSAKAWLKVTKASDTINDSFSISSITDIATGKTTVTSAITFGNQNGSLLGNNNQGSTDLGVYVNWSSTTTWVVYTKDSGGSFIDRDFSSVIHGDLA